MPVQPPPSFIEREARARFIPDTVHAEQREHHYSSDPVFNRFVNSVVDDARWQRSRAYVVQAAPLRSVTNLSGKLRTPTVEDGIVVNETYKIYPWYKGYTVKSDKVVVFTVDGSPVGTKDGGFGFAHVNSGAASGLRDVPFAIMYVPWSERGKYARFDLDMDAVRKKRYEIRFALRSAANPNGQVRNPTVDDIGTIHDLYGSKNWFRGTATTVDRIVIYYSQFPPESERQRCATLPFNVGFVLRAGPKKDAKRISKPKSTVVED